MRVRVMMNMLVDMMLDKVRLDRLNFGNDIRLHIWVRTRGYRLIWMPSKHHLASLNRILIHYVKTSVGVLIHLPKSPHMAKAAHIYMKENNRMVGIR